MKNQCCMYIKKIKNDMIVETCSALTDEAFKEYTKQGKCGNKGCPFFKKSRYEIRRD